MSSMFKFLSLALQYLTYRKVSSIASSLESRNSYVGIPENFASGDTITVGGPQPEFVPWTKFDVWDRRPTFHNPDWVPYVIVTEEKVVPITPIMRKYIKGVEVKYV